MTSPGPRDERERRARERRDDGSYGRRSRSRERDSEHERRYAGRRSRDDVAEYDREKDRFNFDARRVPSDSDRLRRPRTRSRSPRDRERDRERDRARRSDADFGMAARLSGRPRDRDRPNNGGPFDASGRFRPDGADERRDAAERKAPVPAAPPKPKFDSMPGLCDVRGCIFNHDSVFTMQNKVSYIYRYNTVFFYF